MFDRLIAWFTPERRARIGFPLEIALGAWLALAVLLNAQWWGGFAHAVVNLAIALTVGAGVALHRVRPNLALLALLASGVGVLLTFALAAGFPPLTLLGAAIVVFGAAAYGSPRARWIALGISVFATVVLMIAIGGGLGYGGGLGFLVGQLVSFLFFSVLGMLPWLLGELLRSLRKRRALTAEVVTVSGQRDAALTRADLEAERTRVARDVHDIVAHSLTVVIAQADGARYATTKDAPAAAEAFETIAQTARDALADVRVLLTELRHTQPAGPQPGVEDLDALIAAMRDSGLELSLREFGERGRLTEARGLALYRILQEALTNALRHGDGASPTEVELEWGAEAVDLVVTNPVPPGEDEDEAVGEPGTVHGIDGMRERAALVGGELSIHRGAAFRVRARIPLSPREDVPVASEDPAVEHAAEPAAALSRS